MSNSRLEEIRQVRLEKLNKLRELGIDPYPSKFSKSITSVVKAREMQGKTVSTAGRLWRWREHGNVIFADLKDDSGQIQLLFQKKKLEDKFKILKLLDMGDFLGVEGEVTTTQAGEITLDVTYFELLSKSLRPLPDDWHGLKDIEERYRQRYVDLLLNQESRNVFITRAKIVSFLRQYLDNHHFLEVETPVLQPLYGGASAMPFSTHHNALDSEFYLRISDELYLKRLIVGGFDRVYEMSKDFRNEGVDRSHNPEFTMLEFYWAYADYHKLMEFTEEMLSGLVKEITGGYKVNYQEEEINFTPPWPRISYRDAILEHSGIDINQADTYDKLLEEIKLNNIKMDLKAPKGYGALLDAMYKATTRPHLKGPLFLTDRPTEFVTLAKRIPSDPNKTASFQLLVLGNELLNAYNELNDPIDQELRWKESEELGEKGQEEHEVLDRDYIRALEYGMPPTAGWGMGIDRFTSILTNQPSLKDTILFPTLRPEKVNDKS
jgi:lysyl-tRNA synthetase, class II